MMAIGIGNERQFARCAEVLGHPEWATDERFASNRARVENRATIDGLINEALARDDADAWLAKLMAVGIPCGKINSVAEALDDPHTAARDMIETVEHATIGSLRMLDSVRSPTLPARCAAPPTLGQHSDEILSGELGLDAKAIASCARRKSSRTGHDHRLEPRLHRRARHRGGRGSSTTSTGWWSDRAW